MKTLLGIAVLSACAGASVGQITLISNLPGASAGTGTNLGIGTDLVDRTKAVGLTMGADALFFDSMTALLSNVDPFASTAATTVSGGIFSDAAGTVGSQLAAFNDLALGSDQGPAEFDLTVAGGPFTLQANTSYWFVLDGPGVANSAAWDSLASNATPTGSSAASFDGYLFSSNGGATWGVSGVFNGVEINARVIPAPGAAAVLAGAGLLAGRRRR